MPDPKTFPAPRPRAASTPYRKPGVPAPPFLDATKIEAREPSEPPQSHDVMDDLARVELDPRVVEERRTADRFWGVIFLVIGAALLAIAAAFDSEALLGHDFPPFKVMSSFHIFGFGAVVCGIAKLRSRGTSET